MDHVGQVKKYTDQHEWVELEPDGSIGIIYRFQIPLQKSQLLFSTSLLFPFFTNNVAATIGITEYAAKALGDVVFVELPAVNTQVGMGDTIGAVESVKSASDIMSPVTGKIVEANGAVEE